MIVLVTYLALGLAAEHKDRTGHNTNLPIGKGILNPSCDVCLYLRQLWRELEKGQDGEAQQQAKEMAS